MGLRAATLGKDAQWVWVSSGRPITLLVGIQTALLEWSLWVRPGCAYPLFCTEPTFHIRKQLYRIVCLRPWQLLALWLLLGASKRYKASWSHLVSLD